MDSKIKSALDAAGTAADYSARATYQRGYDAGVESMDAFWKSRDTESQIAIGDARYEAKAAQQMVAELRAAIQDMFDKAPSLTPSDAEWKAAAVASLAARKLLTLSAPIAGRWCLASERDAAVARAEAAEAREWALGVQVVAQAQRLKLADELAVALRSISPMLPRSLTTSAHGDPVWTEAIRMVESALAAYDTVPGDNKEKT